MTPILTVEGVRKTYPPSLEVLKGVTFSVLPGEHVAILGRSGSGKTTLLNILGGLDVPTSGRVSISGVDLFGGFGAKSRRTRLRSSKIGFVFQNYQLMNELTALENVMLPVRAGGAGMSLKAAAARARELLEMVGLGERVEHLPKELSGGEEQRVALARALMCSPDIVFADEPTGNLDSLTGEEILKLLFEIGGGRSAVVMVTHSAAAAARSDRRLRLEGGVLTEEVS